jgi:simple sugar transport system ATP-binding protein
VAEILHEHAQSEQEFVKPTPNALIRCEGLEKWYGSVQALTGVNFHAEPGEIVGLVGDNGAGKSTLIKILSGAEQQTSGKIFFAGKEVKLTSPKKAMALGIETIYQYTAMVPAMSIARNMFIGREPLTGLRIGGLGIMDQKSMVAHATKSMTNIDLTRRSPNTTVEELSGGQRQAVAIARTRLADPKIVLMDEPTAAISVRQVAEVLDLIGRLKAAGHAVILISHRMPDVFSTCDRVAVLRRGRKVADKPIAESSPEEVTGLITGAIETA